MNVSKTSNKKKPFVKNILTLITGTTIAQAIPIAISPILTRIYTPEDFGLLALYLSITSIIGVAITARYELAIMLPKDDKDALNLVALSILIASSISIFFLIIILIWGRELAFLLGNEKIYPWLYFVPITLFFTGLYQGFNYWSNRKQEYTRLATNRVVQSTTTAGINLVVGPIKEGSFGLIIGNVISQITATIRLSIKSIKNEKLKLNDISLLRMKVLAKRYDQFPKLSMWSALLNSGSSNMPIFILSAFFNSTIVGWYSMAHRVLKMPMSILGNAVGQIFFQTTSTLKNENPNKLKDVTFRAYKNMLLIGLIPMSIVFGFGDILFSFVFGDLWVEAGNYARILSIWLLLVFVSSPLSMLFTVLEKEGVLLLFNIGIFGTRVLSLLVGALIYKNALVTISLFAISGVIFWLWHCVYILKLVKIPYRKSLYFTLMSIFLVMSSICLLRYLLMKNIW